MVLTRDGRRTGHSPAMSRAQHFAQSLQELERSGDLDAFLDVFADEVHLVRPEPGGTESGRDGARRFWQAYLDQFEHISSDFGRVVDAEQIGELEWVSEGKLATGRDITYAGCSLLEHDDDGKVSRFATYYDTVPFVLGH